MNCSRCSKLYKSGFVKGKQPQQCKTCHYRYTVVLKSTAKSASLKRQALQLYLEDLGFRSIGRFLKVSHVSVYNWIQSFGKSIEEITSNKSIEVVELDELHTYIGDKRLLLVLDCSSQIWKTQFINFILGSRGVKNCQYGN